MDEEFFKNHHVLSFFRVVDNPAKIELLLRALS